MSSGEYDMVSKGKLKLKTDSDHKKKKKKDKKKLKEQVEKTVETYEDDKLRNANTNNSYYDPATHSASGRKLTKAELAFKAMQEKMQKTRIMEKASMTHKMRVEKFNQHLDGLTEHFDIPKVSWTK